MNAYSSLIRSISVGMEDAPAVPLTLEDANKLLALVVDYTKAQSIGRGYESRAYYIYLGGFPALHVALDNKAGTSRLFTLYSEADFLRLKSKMVLY